MPCETKLAPGQTISGRIAEIKAAVEKLSALLAADKVKVIIGPQGSIAFQGWVEPDRNGVSDLCAYRRIMANGSVLARQKIARAEQLAGRTVNRQAVAQGCHSHDGGHTWHDHKG